MKLTTLREIAHKLLNRLINLKDKIDGVLLERQYKNNLTELFPLLHFIKLEPWSDKIWWNTYIEKPHEVILLLIITKN